MGVVFDGVFSGLAFLASHVEVVGDVDRDLWFFDLWEFLGCFIVVVDDLEKWLVRMGGGKGVRCRGDGLSCVRGHSQMS